ncbi:alpha/beta hydrolase [Terriglobus roseus]|uniref:Acetyl esterase/lipase n=1 Tax=Terriglobus roseus TaxID=392734 RepID=A0A1G7EZS9_9BACT|nr:alpha/beta hydrolase [Terriglobus roseus]SDE68966.1 Acetyl esterase/lipase [Terriglobus roseus]
MSRLRSARLLLLCLAVFTCLPMLRAQANTWQPSPGHTQIPIWPGKIPDALPAKGPERMETTTDPKYFIGGKPSSGIENVSRPTMTVYSPKSNNTGVAVVVFPGGGFMELAIDLEGTEVCDWLTTHGITCIVLKYRVPAPRSAPYWGAYPGSPMALEDAQRTMGLVRQHAAEWKINPHKIGVLGFSAGGYMVAGMSVHFDKRIYPRVDAADDQSCRPDFAVALYPGHLGFKRGTLELNPDIASHITAQTPPTFLLQNENDNVDSIWDALSYEAALIKAKVPVEFHSYAEGAHAFGLRPTKYPATAWPHLVEVWLHTIGMLN